MFNPNSADPIFIGDYLDRKNAEAANERAYRRFRGIIFIALMLIFGMGFCVFGWTGANMSPPAKSDIPLWLWNGTFTVTTIGCFITSIICLFEGLDDLFYAKNDRRRFMKTWSRD